MPIFHRLTCGRRRKRLEAPQHYRRRLTEKRDARRGLTVFELTVALFVLTTAMMAIVQLLGVAASQRRTIEQRRAALAEVANQAERIALLTWDEVSSDKLMSWELGDESKKTLPRGAATIEIQNETEPVPARRIQLSVRTSNAAGQEIDLATLTVWKFAPRGEP